MAFCPRGLLVRLEVLQARRCCKGQAGTKQHSGAGPPACALSAGDHGAPSVKPATERTRSRVLSCLVQRLSENSLNKDVGTSRVGTDGGRLRGRSLSGFWNCSTERPWSLNRTLCLPDPGTQHPPPCRGSGGQINPSAGRVEGGSLHHSPVPRPPGPAPSRPLLNVCLFSHD